MQHEIIRHEHVDYQKFVESFRKKFRPKSKSKIPVKIDLKDFAHLTSQAPSQSQSLYLDPSRNATVISTTAESVRDSLEGSATSLCSKVEVVSPKFTAEELFQLALSPIVEEPASQTQRVVAWLEFDSRL